MCISAAGRVTTVTDTEALVELDGAERIVSVAPIVLDGRTVRPGDWVLVHTGLAMDVISEATAKDMTEFSRLVRGTGEEKG